LLSNSTAAAVIEKRATQIAIKSFIFPPLFNEEILLRQ
jgi:hypothetical protein